MVIAITPPPTIPITINVPIIFLSLTLGHPKNFQKFSSKSLAIDLWFGVSSVDYFGEFINPNCPLEYNYLIANIVYNGRH
jgi:hypothetical protein